MLNKLISDTKYVPFRFQEIDKYVHWPSVQAITPYFNKIMCIYPSLLSCILSYKRPSYPLNNNFDMSNHKSNVLLSF